MMTRTTRLGRRSPSTCAGGRADGVSLGAATLDQQPWAVLLERLRPGEDLSLPAQGRWLRTAVQSCLAGDAAVSLAAGTEVWREGSPEVPRALALVEEHSHGRTDDAQVFERLMWRESRRWLGKPRNWALVEAVAGALVREQALDAARFNAVIEDARHRAWHAARKSMPSVDRAGKACRGTFRREAEITPRFRAKDGVVVSVFAHAGLPASIAHRSHPP